MGFLFQYRATIDDDIFVIDVELDDAAANLLPDQLLHLRSVAQTAARRRHERARSHVHAEAALDCAGDAAGNDFFGFECARQPLPIPRPRTGHARQRRHPLAVVTGDRHVKVVAALDAQVAVSVQKVGGWNHALGLCAVIDQDEVPGHSYNGAPPRRTSSLPLASTFGARRRAARAFKLIQNVGERLVRRVFVRHGFSTIASAN